jgi:haloacetate dehalogenase
MATMFPDFTQHRLRVSGAEINFRRGGEGPPLLLLHGFPQTHACWHKMAPDLARSFTVIAADLRGYGDSSKPPSAADHAPYSKRTMARDMVEVMRALGFARFALAGHDRGARVAYRLALDHPQAVTKLAVLDIVPTHAMWKGMDARRALGTYHWMFLAQPDGLPERLIGAEPEYYLRETLRRWAAPGHVFDPAAMAEYLRCFRDPAAIHAMCEDYRAGADIDVMIDAADYERRRIGCPVLVLWGQRGFAKGSDDAPDPLAIWRQWADDVRGEPISCGHFLPEEAPDETGRAISDFLGEAPHRSGPVRG